jgi:signal transduction histidine kinase
MTTWKQNLVKHKRKWWSLVVIALLATGLNYSWSLDGRADGQLTRQTVRVGLGTLTETVIATGVIRPMVGAEINVGSRISSTVISMPVEVGDRVEVKQLLAELDSTALEAAADQVRAAVALAGEVIDSLQTIPPGITLNVPPQSLEIAGDQALIKVLIQNLVDNAVKFSLPDSDPVEVSLSQTEDMIQIIVEDDGQGIAMDQAEKVFEPFVKLDPSRGHRAGYGLGLNICQRIVQAQGGSIEIQAREKRGLRVSVCLPRIT